MGMLEMIRVSLFGASNRGGVPFDPSKDIPSLAGKVILVTGGAGGIGKEAVLEFARHDPAHVYLADLPQADEGVALLEVIHTTIPNARVSFLPVNLGSFESIRKAATQLREKEERLDICLFNAGVMPVKPSTTVDGYESAWGINYLGHCLLARLLMPTLLKTTTLPDADVRLVFVSSEGHVMLPKEGIAFDKLKTPCSDVKYYHRYGQSKLAINLLMRDLAEKHPQIKAVAVHPGRIATGLANELAKYSVLEQEIVSGLQRRRPPSQASTTSPWVYRTTNQSSREMQGWPRSCASGRTASLKPASKYCTVRVHHGIYRSARLCGRSSLQLPLISSRPWRPNIQSSPSRFLRNHLETFPDIYKT